MADRKNYPWGTAPRTHVELDASLMELHLGKERSDKSKLTVDELHQLWKNLKKEVRN